MRRLISVVFASLMLSTQAIAAKWVSLGTTETGTLSIDVDGIKRLGTTRVFWERQTYDKPLEDGSSHSITRIVFDCGEERYKTTQVTAYKGELSTDTWETNDGWQYVVPDSIYEDVMKVVCT